MLVVDYVPILAFILLGAFLSAVFVLGSVFLGPSIKTPNKQMPFECGHYSDGKPKNRFAIKFYGVAVLFILFDIEVVFLYPWAVVFDQLGLFAIVEMLIFVGVLLVALAYVWANGGLEWE